MIALCLSWVEDEHEDEPRELYLYRTGCAFRMNTGLILEEGGKYQLVHTPKQVKELLLPLDSPEKALTYLEMMTGLSATFDFEADPMLLYFQDPLQATHIVESNGVYTANLFQYAHFLCEPWVDSEVVLSVDRNGNITVNIP